MARKRASLKDKGEEILGVKRGGQGADILFGSGTKSRSRTKPKRTRSKPKKETPDETPVAVSPEEESPPKKTAPNKAPRAKVVEAEEGLPQGEADLDEELDLDSLLGAEAEAAEGETALPELATTPAAPAPPPSVPVAPPSPPPAVERPLPAPPPAVPTAGVSATVPLPTPAATSPIPAIDPPSTDTGAPDLSAPRPHRYIQMVSGDFDLLAEETSADAAAAALLGVPEGIQLTPEQRSELLRRRSVQAKLAELDKAIDGQYDRILREDISVNADITDRCHKLLRESRAIVLHRQVEQLAKAEWNVEQVRARLDRAGESRKQANRYSWPIALWGMAWFAAFVYLIFNPALIFEWFNLTDVNDQFLVPEIFLRSLFFGGIGGVAAVFYHLFKYVSQRSFDSQYGLSFVGKPFMGMILGSMIYLTVFVAMRVLGLAPIGLEQESGQTVTDVMYMALLFFIAMAAGFKENLAFDLLNRVIKALLGTEDAERAPSPPSITTGTGS
jgi:hypothetical protein